MMAAGPVFTVTDPWAPRKAVDPDIGQIAEAVRRSAAAQSPVRTGRLARGYRTERGRYPAVRLLVNDVPYWRYVEYGTRRMRARPAFGRAMAEARARVSRR